MKTVFKTIGAGLAMFLVTPSVSFGLGIEAVQAIVPEPEARNILVADDDRPFWWRHGSPAWQSGDDDWDDDDDDRWDDDDDDNDDD